MGRGFLGKGQAHFTKFLQFASSVFQKILNFFQHLLPRITLIMVEGAALSVPKNLGHGDAYPSNTPPLHSLSLICRIADAR